jgi:hypothetical protein
MPTGKYKARGGGRPQCRICSHRECARIELALVSGRAKTAIAAEFGVSHDSVQRHWQNHVSLERRRELVVGPLQLAELAKVAAEQGLSQLQWLEVTRTELWNISRECREKGLILDAISALRVMAQVTSQISTLTGEIRSSGLSVTHVHGNVNTQIVSDGRSAIDMLKEEILRCQERMALPPVNGAGNGSEIETEAGE